MGERGFVWYLDEMSVGTCSAWEGGYLVEACMDLCSVLSGFLPKLFLVSISSSFFPFHIGTCEYWRKGNE